MTQRVEGLRFRVLSLPDHNRRHAAHGGEGGEEILRNRRGRYQTLLLSRSSSPSSLPPRSACRGGSGTRDRP